MANLPNVWAILLADDSDDDRFFLRKVVKKYPSLSVCGEVKDGCEAIDYLVGTGEFADRTKYPLPDVMVLDLKMPRKSGYEVLSWIKESPFQSLPVFVCSGSTLDIDRETCLNLGATAFCPKTASLKGDNYILTVIQKWLASKRG